MYLQTETDLNRLAEGIRAAYATPFVDDLEDYIWEIIFSYVKNISLVDTLTHIRRKLLFDVIDEDRGIGWSAKALRTTVTPLAEFELVIQRADILKKREWLGFPELSLQSPPQQLGEALLKHWYTKVSQDALAQNVQEKRIAILLKSRSLRKFALLEDDFAEYAPEALEWHWTDRSQIGLQGIHHEQKRVIFRWYRNQKQLFERFVVPLETQILELNPQRLPLETTVRLLLDALKLP